jgi:chromate transport protein ChrA
MAKHRKETAVNGLIEKIRNEPVLVTGFLAAVIALVTAFGLNLSNEQVAAINAVVIAVLAFVARKKVVPTRKL